jgi:hypothetical protein
VPGVGRGCGGHTGRGRSACRCRAHASVLSRATMHCIAAPRHASAIAGTGCAHRVRPWPHIMSAMWLAAASLFPGKQRRLCLRRWCGCAGHAARACARACVRACVRVASAVLWRRQSGVARLLRLQRPPFAARSGDVATPLCAHRRTVAVRRSWTRGDPLDVRAPVCITSDTSCVMPRVLTGLSLLTYHNNARLIT